MLKVPGVSVVPRFAGEVLDVSDNSGSICRDVNDCFRDLNVIVARKIVRGVSGEVDSLLIVTEAEEH